MLCDVCMQMAGEGKNENATVCSVAKHVGFRQDEDASPTCWPVNAWLGLWCAHAAT